MCIVCSTALYKPAGVFQTRVPLIARIPDAPRWKAENGSSVRDRLDYYSIRLILKKKKSDFPSRLSLLLSFAFFEKLGSIIRLNLNINFNFGRVSKLFLPYFRNGIVGSIFYVKILSRPTKASSMTQRAKISWKFLVEEEGEAIRINSLRYTSVAENENFHGFARTKEIRRRNSCLRIFFDELSSAPLVIVRRRRRKKFKTEEGTIAGK